MLKILHCLLAAIPLLAQTTPARLEFDVASGKPSVPSSSGNANFPLGPGDAYSPNGGYFTATNFPLVTYISFAYKVLGNQMSSLVDQLPSWVTTERFDIQARAQGNPTKDQMRLMVRALLADRFKLAIHTESREVPVLALVPVKPDKLGPQLRAHPADSPCPTDPAPRSGADAPEPQAPPDAVDGGFPGLCGGLLMLPASAPGRYRGGARNVTMPFIANALTATGDLGRPIVDRTGLTGNFDYVLEWTPEIRGPVKPGVELDTTGPTFEEALRAQLGLKLESQKGSIDVFILDHVEHPSGN